MNENAGPDVSGDFDATERRDEGASMRKLQLSLFLSQFAHIGCLPSHYVRIVSYRIQRQIDNCTGLIDASNPLLHQIDSFSCTTSTIQCSSSVVTVDIGSCRNL